MFGVACPHCGQVFAYAEQYEGKMVACTNCQGQFLMEGGHVPPPPPMVKMAAAEQIPIPAVVSRTSRLPKRRNNNAAAIIAGSLALAMLGFVVFFVVADATSPPTSNRSQVATDSIADMTQTGVGLVMLLVCFALGLLFYLVPTVIAFTRKHQNAAAIAALNILLGWTFLGWIASLVWSLTEVSSREHRHYHYDGGH